LASSLSKWLHTKDHESSPIPNKAIIAQYPQLSSALTLTMFSMNHECTNEIDPTLA